MKNFLMSVGVSLFLIGCGDQYDPNLAQNPSANEMSQARARRDEAVAIYKRAGGDWDKMTPEDKSRILALSNNNEAMARQGWPALASLAK